MKIIKNLNHFFPTHTLGNEKDRIIVYVKNDNPEIFTKIIRLIFKSYSPDFKNRKIITFPIKYNSIKKRYYKEAGCFCDDINFDLIYCHQINFKKAFKASEFEEIAEMLAENIYNK
jgi:hypothetical protein